MSWRKVMTWPRLRLDDLASFSGSIRHYSLQGEMMWGIFIIMGGLWENFCYT